MMRIFYLAHFDCTRATGHAYHVRSVVRELDRHGHEVWLYASGWEDDPASHVHFVPVPQWRLPGLYNLSFAAAASLFLVSHLLRHRPDVIYARFSYALPVLLLIAWLFRVPAVTELNSDVDSERNALGVRGMVRWLLQGLEHTVYSWSSGLVAVAPEITHSIRRRFGRLDIPTVVIPNGVDIELYHPQDARECRRRLGLPEERHYVAYAGAFQRWQGLATLVEAAARVIPALPDVTFLLVGDGSEYRPIEELIRRHDLDEKVLLTGTLAPAQVGDYIGASDICVAPYNALAAPQAGREGCPKGTPMTRSPLKVYTYLACGRPVLATHFQEAGEFVQGVDAGLSLPPDDADALAAAIQRLLCEPALAERMGKAGREVAEREHSWVAVTRRLLDYLQQTIMSSARG